MNNTRVAEKNAASYVGKSFSEFITYLERNDLIVTNVIPMEPQRTGQMELLLGFMTKENSLFANTNRLRQPSIRVFFDGDIHFFNEAWGLATRYRGDFNEVVKAFYSNLTIREIKFSIPPRMRFTR